MNTNGVVMCRSLSCCHGTGTAILYVSKACIVICSSPSMRLGAGHNKRDCDLHAFILFHQFSILPSKYCQDRLALVWDICRERAPEIIQDCLPLKKEGGGGREGKHKKSPLGI